VHGGDRLGVVAQFSQDVVGVLAEQR
jgi:hypothetical protein